VTATLRNVFAIDKVFAPSLVRKSGGVARRDILLSATFTHESLEISIFQW